MSNSDQARHAAAVALLDHVLAHLANESRHLDEMIVCSRELQRQLRRQTEDGGDELAQLFQEIERQQAAINQTRGGVIADLATLPGAPANLSAYLSLLAEDQAMPIRQLRNEIVEKLDTVRSITLGNQMVFHYSHDFYQRMLRALTGNEAQPGGYGPSGRRESVETGKVMLRNC
ncbi:MAG: flagellar export chaperone FlgN [Planctomycetota bacterium]|jgi:hypothetical protein